MPFVIYMTLYKCNNLNTYYTSYGHNIVLSNTNKQHIQELQKITGIFTYRVLEQNKNECWIRSTNFSNKQRFKSLQNNKEIEFIFIVAQYNVIFVALKYKSILLLIKELGQVYSYNDLYKVFNWVANKDVLNLDILELFKYLIDNKWFEFDAKFNDALNKAEDYQVKVEIFK